MDIYEERNIIKSILNIRSRDGATVENIQDDFTDLVGKSWRMAERSFDEIDDYMSSIDGVYHFDASAGPTKWYIRSEDCVHLQKLILAQKHISERSPEAAAKKPPRMKMNHRNSMANKSIGTKECFFRDNYVYKNKRYRVPHSTASYECANEKNSNATHLLGDDLFLSLLHSDHDPTPERKSSLRFSLCKWGLTISAALALVKTLAKGSVIVINVGTVDILQGRDMATMQKDYAQLVNVCVDRGIQPIITTIVPLTNARHSWQLQTKLIAFNNFLMETYCMTLGVFDLWSQFVTPQGRVRREYLETDAIKTTHCDDAHVLWNQRSRRVVSDFIHKILSRLVSVRVCTFV